MDAGLAGPALSRKMSTQAWRHNVATHESPQVVIEHTPKVLNQRHGTDSVPSYRKAWLIDQVRGNAALHEWARCPFTCDRHRKD